MTNKEAARIVFNNWWMSQTWDMEHDPPPPKEIVVKNLFDEAMKMAYDALMKEAKHE